jgi:general secretion pathway protein D
LTLRLTHQATRRKAVAAAALALFLLDLACASSGAYHEGVKAYKAQRYDQAVVDLSRAVAKQPDSTRYKVALARARMNAAQEHFQKGDQYRRAGLLDEAISEFQQAVFLDSSHQLAANELQKSVAEWQKRQEAQSWDLEKMKKRAKASPGREAPRLNPSANIPIVLRFKDENVKKIYDALSKASGINFVYDERLPLDKKISVDLADVTFEQAMDQLMTMNKHFYKILDENSLYIAEDNPQKHKELDDLVIQTFYLSNADVKDVQVLLRTLLDARQIAQNDRLNAITIRDTPERVQVAQKIIEANDKAKSELIVDVELLEVNRNILQNLGIDLFGVGSAGGTGKALNLSFGGGSSVALNNLDVLKQAGSWLVGPIPGVVVNFLKTDADAQVIAKPQLRVSEGAKATVRIGDRIPIPNTTFNSAPTVGGTVGVPITSFTYQNVGINIDLEPRVHHNREITLKGKIEISSLAGQVAAGGGLTQPIIGTREIESTIRLRDNETNILAGLIREEERHSLSGVPGLSDIPVLKRLFGSTETTIQSTDIVLMITPHIIRIPDISEEDLEALWVGTDSNVALRGASRKSAVLSPFENGNGEQPYPGIPDLQEEKVPAPEKEEAEPQDETTPPTPENGPGADQNGTGGGLVAPATGAGTTVAPAPTTPPPTGPSTGLGGNVNTGGTGTVGGGQAGGGGQGGGAQNGSNPPQTPPDNGKKPQPATVSFNPAYMTVPLGGNFNVAVTITGGENVGSVPFHVGFDPGMLKYVGSDQISPFLTQDGASVFVLATQADNKREVIVGLSRQGRGPGANGNGRLVQLTFQPLKQGTTTLTFTDLSVLDPQAQPLPSERLPMTVVVQ